MAEYNQRVFDILVHPEKCVGCLICQLRCSLRLTNSFNPARAAILIDRSSNELGASITFTDACDGCAICARNCPYGALELKRKESIKNDNA
ncbi:MAG TPA: hypothetical protein ENG51_09175 [Deltaproteobacteria bacterium]|nr:MAG: hypothetical protein B1H11_00665 [Desulfobacteraceae bacterium 4484_190.1]HDM76627.1 hypothetical protein [Deltaproteobacteria bacterium]